MRALLTCQGEQKLHYGTGLSFLDSVHPSPPMPRWATAFNFVIPTGVDPDFLNRKSGVA